MTSGYISLGYGDLAMGASLIVLDAGLSVALRLGLERQILVAGLRMMVQLAIIGMVLTTLFTMVSPVFTGLALGVMIVFAGFEIMQRQDKKLAGLWNWTVAISSITLSATLITGLALTTTLRPDPWYAPQYVIPLLGMILGNTMTGVSLGLNVLTTGAVSGRSAIEAQLMLGATRSQALAPLVRTSLRTALMPIINVMASTGIISLPGMMTGQILGGVPPEEAVKYQILILSLVAGSIGIGSITAVLTAAWRLTDHRHRLRLDRLRG